MRITDANCPFKAAFQSIDEYIDRLKNKISPKEKFERALVCLRSIPVLDSYTMRQASLMHSVCAQFCDVFLGNDFPRSQTPVLQLMREFQSSLPISDVYVCFAERAYQKYKTPEVLDLLISACENIDVSYVHTQTCLGYHSGHDEVLGAAERIAENVKNDKAAALLLLSTQMHLSPAELYFEEASDVFSEQTPLVESFVRHFGQELINYCHQNIGNKNKFKAQNVDHLIVDAAGSGSQELFIAALNIPARIRIDEVAEYVLDGNISLSRAEIEALQKRQKDLSYEGELSATTALLLSSYGDNVLDLVDEDEFSDSKVWRKLATYAKYDKSLKVNKENSGQISGLFDRYGPKEIIELSRDLKEILSKSKKLRRAEISSDFEI